MQRESFLVLFQLLRSLEQIFAPPMIAFLGNTIQTFFSNRPSRKEVFQHATKLEKVSVTE